MFLIRCHFRKAKEDTLLDGFAICSDPNTPITFIYPNGEAHIGDIWSYYLRHFEPWFKISRD